MSANNSEAASWHWGFFAAAFAARPLAWLLAFAQRHDLRELELGCGGYPGSHHCPSRTLLARPSALARWRQQFRSAGITPRVLSCHGNPIHPNPDVARAHDAALRRAILLAAELQIETVVTFSGVAGSREASGCCQLNWPVLSWPYEQSDYWHRVWKQQLIPYWQQMTMFAERQGVRIALELHGGFLVHSPGTLLALRQACGPALGANLDPSHLWWQGMDPLRAIELLGPALFHVHLKDWQADARQQAMWGWLDPRDERLGERSWRYCLPGRGHDADFWRAFLSGLHAIGYRGMLSLEHEDVECSAESSIPSTLGWLHSLR